MSLPHECVLMAMGLYLSMICLNPATINSMEGNVCKARSDIQNSLLNRALFLPLYPFHSTSIPVFPMCFFYSFALVPASAITSPLLLPVSMSCRTTPSLLFHLLFLPSIFAEPPAPSLLASLPPSPPYLRKSLS